MRYNTAMKKFKNILSLIPIILMAGVLVFFSLWPFIDIVREQGAGGLFAIIAAFIFIAMLFSGYKPPH